MSTNSPLPPFNRELRYSIPEAIRFLKTSREGIYRLINSGELKTITVGNRCTKRGQHAGRRWVPGSEIARLSQAPAT